MEGGVRASRRRPSRNSEPGGRTRWGRFAGKKVLVTGAGRGFGRTLALAFAQEGAASSCTTTARRQARREVAREVRALGRVSATVKGDISSHADVLNITRSSFGALGYIDILVNNVGDMALEQYLLATVRREGDRSYAGGGCQGHDVHDP